MAQPLNGFFNASFGRSFMKKLPTLLQKGANLAPPLRYSSWFDVVPPVSLMFVFRYSSYFAIIHVSLLLLALHCCSICFIAAPHASLLLLCYCCYFASLLFLVFWCCSYCFSCFIIHVVLLLLFHASLLCNASLLCCPLAQISILPLPPVFLQCIGYLELFGKKLRSI